MPQLNEYASYEYAITIGEGRLFAYGISTKPFIINRLCEAASSYGNVTLAIDIALPTCETGSYTVPALHQIY